MAARLGVPAIGCAQGPHFVVDTDVDRDASLFRHAFGETSRQPIEVCRRWRVPERGWQSDVKTLRTGKEDQQFVVVDPVTLNQKSGQASGVTGRRVQVVFTVDVPP